MAEIESLYRATTDQTRRIRRLNITFGSLLPEARVEVGLFDDGESDAREHNLQKSVLAVKHKYGKNALVKGISLSETATGRERNRQIGGHNA